MESEAEGVGCGLHQLLSSLSLDGVTEELVAVVGVEVCDEGQLVSLFAALRPHHLAEQAQWQIEAGLECAGISLVGGARDVAACEGDRASAWLNVVANVESQDLDVWSA